MNLFRIIAFLILGLAFKTSYSQSGIFITNDLKIDKISEHTYVHTSGNNNGIIYIVKNKAIVASTPDTDTLTSILISYIQDTLNLTIVAYILDIWHSDAMGGINAVLSRGIKTYANNRTIAIAKEKKLPLPEYGFNKKIEIPIGDKKVVCQYFGEAHTTDAPVVWIPEDKVLFGSNKVRNYNGWVGNIGNANIYAWANTISSIKKEYKKIVYVVPGHGKYGGPELLDYTIELFKPNKWYPILKKHNCEINGVFKEYDKLFVIAQFNEPAGEYTIFKNAVIFIERNQFYYMVKSPLVEINKNSLAIRSEYGTLQKFANKKKKQKAIDDVYYHRLFINFDVKDVDMTIIFKDFIK